VLANSVEKACWQRNLLRFLHLQKRFVLPNNTWRLEIDGTLPGQIMTAPLHRATAALKHAGGSLAAFFLWGSICSSERNLRQR